jgi:RNA polymerase sigma factor
VVVMQYDAINARLAELRSNTEKIGRFVEDYKPFIASCAVKASGRPLSYETDDELSIAMAAFVEAIDSFDSSKGNFFTFARNVIKRRLIDYYRSERRHSNVISLNLYMEQRDEEYDLSSEEAVRNYSDQRLAELRRLELEELGGELAQWGITYRDLARVSPKHKRTRQQCAELAGIILSKPELLEPVMTKKYLPVAEIERISGLPRKLIERFRKYIIALVVIAIGDYEYIKDYIKL